MLCKGVMDDAGDDSWVCEGEQVAFRLVPAMMVLLEKHWNKRALNKRTLTDIAEP